MTAIEWPVSKSRKSGERGCRPAGFHYGRAMIDARLATQIERILGNFQRGITLPDEAAQAFISILANNPADPPLFDDSWELRVALAAVLNPNRYYQSIARFVPSAIPPVDFAVDVGVGWSLGATPSALGGSLAVVQLVPPEHDLLVGLASIYSSPPAGTWSHLGACNDMDFSSAPDLGHSSLSSPRCAVSVEPGPDGILAMAHTTPQVRAAVSHFTAYGLPQQPILDEPAAFAVIQNTLASVNNVLCLRRGWRGKHPSWGVMPSGLLPVLCCAPKHIPEARDWRADGLLGGDATNAVEVLCAEINRLEPSLLAPDGPNRMDLRDHDTLVIEIIEQWRETLADST